MPSHSALTVPSAPPGSQLASETPANPESEVVDGVGRKKRIWARASKTIAAGFKSNIGLLLIMAAQAFFSLMNLSVKKLNSIDPPVSTFQLIAVRMIITYAFSMVYMLSAKVPDPWLGPKGVRLLLLFRGFSGFFGLFGIYYSLQYLSLSDATVLTFLSPIVTGIAGAIFLKEKYTIREALAGIFSLFGVVLIARPAFLFGSPRTPDIFMYISTEVPLMVLENDERGTPEQRLVAVGVAMLGVLGMTGAYTSIAAIGKQAHPMHAMTSFSYQCVIVTALAMIIQGEPVVIPGKLEWIALLVLIGVFGFIAQILLTMGLQRETAGRGSIAVYTQIVFASILERIFFEVEPSIFSKIGTTIIVVAALYVAVAKAKGRRDQTRLREQSHQAQDSNLEAGLLANEHEEQPDGATAPLIPEGISGTLPDQKDAVGGKRAVGD